jgi:dolichyl-phosphate-mannose-protein mannosyltransferase
MTRFLHPDQFARRVIAPIFLLLFFSIGLYLRINQMFTTSDVLLYQREYDEGVYISSAQLLLQGHLPYRDFQYVEPPLALAIYAAVLSSHPILWGDASTFELARYSTIGFGLITLVGVSILARRLGGWTSALFSVGLLATDALVIEIDRRAMLEPIVNAFSIFALICYVQALDREKSWIWLSAAALLGVFAALLKTAGVIVLGVILLHALWRILDAVGRRELASAGKSRVRAFVVLLLAAAVGVIAVTGYFIITNPMQFLRQVYLFHFLRPADGVLSVADRFNEIISNPGSHLTIWMAAGGLAIILMRGIMQHDWREWRLLVLWMIAVLGMIVVAKTFYLHYFVQATVPLALIAGALVSKPKPQAPDVNRSSGRHKFVAAAQLLVAILLVITNLIPGVAQFETALDVPNLRSQVDLRPIRRFLATNTPANAQVLGFEPIYALIASRQPAGPSEDSFLVDSYGYLLYENIGLDENMFHPINGDDVTQVMHNEKGQQQIVGIAKRADYVVIDDRARQQLTLETLTMILQGRAQVFETGQVEVYGPAVAEQRP